MSGKEHRRGESRKGFFPHYNSTAGAAVQILFSGVGGGKSGRPQISVPPIPPASSSRPIAMPLDSYEQVAGNEQEVLVEASSLLTQRCMTARGFSYPEAAQPSTELSALQQTENSPVGLTKLGQAQIYGYAKPKSGTGSSGPVFFGLVGGQVFGQAIQDHGAAWVTALLGFSPCSGRRATPGSSPSTRPGRAA